MRCFLHGNIRISPDFRIGLAVDRAAQRFEVGGVANQLLHLDADAIGVPRRLAMGHLAEQHAIVLIDAHGGSRFERDGRQEAEAAAGQVQRAPGYRLGGRVGQTQHEHLRLQLSTGFAASFHAGLIGHNGEICERRGKIVFHYGTTCGTELSEENS